MNLNNIKQNDLGNNSIKELNFNDFIGLNNLQYLNLKFNNILKINSTNRLNVLKIKQVEFSITDLSFGDICRLKNSFKAEKIRTFANIEYFSPIYIENRINIDWVKTIILFKSRMIYNFINENFDVVDFFKTCNNIEEMREKI